MGLCWRASKSHATLGPDDGIKVGAANTPPDGFELGFDEGAGELVGTAEGEIDGWLVGRLGDNLGWLAGWYLGQFLFLFSLTNQPDDWTP